MNKKAKAVTAWLAAAVVMAVFTGCKNLDAKSDVAMNNKAATLAERVLSPNAKPHDILVVLAHPDDETWLSGTLARLAQLHRVNVVYVSSGDAGSDRSGRELSNQVLAQEREAEVTAALKALSVKAAPIFWRFPDTQLVSKASTITHKLVTTLNTQNPQLVISFGGDGVTGHPDHTAVARVTVDAFSRWQQSQKIAKDNLRAQLWQVAVSNARAEQAGNVAAAMQHPFRIAKPIDNQRVDVQVDVSAYQQQRRAAFAQHKTQFPQSMQMLWNAFLPVDNYEEFHVVVPD